MNKLKVNKHIIQEKMFILILRFDTEPDFSWALYVALYYEADF
jgi:hypothetical protein